MNITKITEENILGDRDQRNTRKNSYPNATEQKNDPENSDDDTVQDLQIQDRSESGELESAISNTNESSSEDESDKLNKTFAENIKYEKEAAILARKPNSTHIVIVDEESEKNLENSGQSEDSSEGKASEIATDLYNQYLDNVRNKTKNIKMTGEYKNVLKLIQYIPIFTGARTRKLTEELNVFLKGCRDVYDNIEQVEKDIFMKLIGNRLRGEAFLLVARMKFETLADLQKYLIKHYTPVKTPADISREITTLRQLPTESILSFAERLQSLAAVAIESLENKYPDKNIELLRDEIQEQAIKTFKAV